MGVCDNKVFKGIFFRWSNPLQVFLRARGLDLSTAQDITQECFARLWKHCDEVSEEKVKSYLFTTASRIQIDQYRRSKVALKYKNQTSPSNSTEDGQYALEMKEFKGRLEAAIDSMNDLSREVFMLNRFEDMTYKSIAEALDISVKAVEKRMSKALAHLYAKKVLQKK